MYENFIEKNNCSLPCNFDYSLEGTLLPFWQNDSYDNITNISTGIQDAQPTEDDDWMNFLWYTPYPNGFSQLRIILTAFFVTVIMILIVVGNMLVCIAIATERALKTVQNWFIASLAVSDFLVGLVIMPFSLAQELMGYWIFGTIWCDIHAALDVFLCTASINSLCMISLDRYWSVTHAVEYLKKRTPSRAMAMICFVWLLSALISLPPLVGWKKKDEPSEFPICLLSKDIGYVLYSALGSFYIPAIVMVFVYIRIFMAARTRARRNVHKPRQAPEYTNEQPKDKSTTTTNTTLSNPSPPDKNKNMEMHEKLSKSNGTTTKVVPSVIIATPAPQIIIETDSPRHSTDNGDLSRTHDSLCEETTFCNERSGSDNESPKKGDCSHLYTPEQEQKRALLSTPKLMRSPYGSTLSLADYCKSEEDISEHCEINLCGRFRKKSKPKPEKISQQPRSHLTAEAERQKRKLAKARERRATLILGLIMASFILAWLPFFVLYVVEAMCQSCTIDETGFAVAFWLGYCNSALNPIIYTIFNRDFRRAFRKILFK
ncbi:alpha-2A adrenergic receptor-like [Centruroides sculpturatus]|uniref:alpha-2A adrenergic receptor-like n=1 Tax=Centruroides sculpturatus TaxID=218467 RepID=UPI000C6DE58D|nr:alpha-2A adrenergic receptor-like [Centruroides sculpturatus]XP_023231558.1 alpha-2A adrenergic receptor-like [Centruroides sculpturatus]XP_023231566.1 alpha-2A adrenergic receptor-like [Centruroides sculpturatus]